MNFPNELRYSRSHEWVKPAGDEVVIGISDYAQHELGDVVFVNLPQAGDRVSAGQSFGDVESVKAVSDLICPVSGVVRQTNEALLETPETLNSDPYGAWLIRVAEVSGTEELLESAEYEAFCAAEA